MVPPLMLSRSEYRWPYAVVLVSLSWKACVPWPDREVVQRSIAVLLPPLCQKSGTPSLLTSVSRVGFGQKLPGSRPAGSCRTQARLKTTVNRTAARCAIYLKHASLLISFRGVCSWQQIGSNLIANILIVSGNPDGFTVGQTYTRQRTSNAARQNSKWKRPCFFLPGEDIPRREGVCACELTPERRDRSRCQPGERCPGTTSRGRLKSNPLQAASRLWATPAHRRIAPCRSCRACWPKSG